MSHPHQRSGRMTIAAAFALLLLGSSDSEVSALQSGQLTAGDIDDGLNFDLYLRYKKRTLSRYGEQSQERHPLPDVRLADRVPVIVVDSVGNPFSNAIVEVRGVSDGVVFEVPAGTNGRATLFPAIDFEQGGEVGQVQTDTAVAESRQIGGDRASWRIAARAPGGSCPQDCGEADEIGLLQTSPDEGAKNGDWAGAEAVAVALPGTSSLPNQLDLALVLDTTGSMCDELDYLQSELRSVITSVVGSNGQHGNIRGRRLEGIGQAVSDGQVPVQGQGINADVRVGIVAYRDHGDEYVVNTSPFTSSNAAIAGLTTERCGGGGDYPEAMDEALEAASYLQWAEGNVARVAFIVADAPPHAENYKRTLQAAIELRRKGVRVYGIAASGVADEAEYMMRLMSLITGARYTWLTNDSGIGNPHAEPKVKCYQVTRLDKLLVRLLKSELTGTRIEAGEDEIIREVGSQENGVCIVDFQPDEVAPPTKSPAVLPEVMPAADGEVEDSTESFAAPPPAAPPAPSFLDGPDGAGGAESFAATAAASSGPDGADGTEAMEVEAAREDAPAALPEATAGDDSYGDGKSDEAAVGAAHGGADHEDSTESLAAPAVAPSGSDGAEATEDETTGDVAPAALPEATAGDDSHGAGPSDEATADVGHGVVDLEGSSITSAANCAPFLLSGRLGVCLVTLFTSLLDLW